MSQGEQGSTYVSGVSGGNQEEELRYIQEELPNVKLGKEVVLAAQPI